MSKNRFAKSAEQVESFSTKQLSETTVNNDIISSVNKTSKPKAKAYTFYLDDDIVDKLKSVSELQGVSASKMLNHILKNTL